MTGTTPRTAGSSVYLGEHEPLPHGWCRHRWRNRQTRDVICPYSEGYAAGRAEAAAPRLTRSEVRRVITNAYYGARNEGETMETAADRAADAVMALAALPPDDSPPEALDVLRVFAEIDPDTFDPGENGGDYDFLREWVAKARATSPPRRRSRSDE